MSFLQRILFLATFILPNLAASDVEMCPPHCIPLPIACLCTEHTIPTPYAQVCGAQVCVFVHTPANTAVVWGHVFYVLSGGLCWHSSLAWFKITVSGRF